MSDSEDLSPDSEDLYPASELSYIRDETDETASSHSRASSAAGTRDGDGVDADGTFLSDITIESDIFTTDPEIPDATYEDLQDGEIRLLQISADLADGKISCELSSISLQDEPVYSALSYAWGRGPARCAIKLNGRHFYVRKNLWRFLNQVKELDCNRFGRMWIDALCINQADTEERTSQVSIMPKIYSMAEQVIVWLGPAYQNSDVAMRKLLKPISYWRAKRKSLRTSHSVGMSIRRLCMRVYWTRLWVLQELLLARKVWIMCGARVNPWLPLRDLLREVDEKNPDGGSSIAGPEGFRSETIQATPAASMALQSTQSLEHTPLWNLLVQTQGLGCAEVMDRVYALLGIAEAGDSGIIADYSVPIPTLLNLVLKHHYEQEPPKSLKDVVQDCEMAEKLLSADFRSIFSLPDERGDLPFHTDADIDALPLSHTECYPVNLWWASIYGHSAVERLLFAEKALDRKDVLMPAIEMGNPAAVQILLRMPEVELDTGNSSDDPDDPDDPDESEEPGEPPLSLAARGGGARFAKIVELLLGTGRVEPNWQDELGRTALHQAVRYKREAIVKLLLDTKDIDINVQNNDDYTPLHHAVASKHENIMRLLLDSSKIDVNLTNWRGQTPLLRAILTNNEHAATMILDTGKADTTIRCKIGQYPLRIAVERGLESIVKILLDLCQNKLDKIDIEEIERYSSLLRVAVCNSRAGSHMGIVKLFLDTDQFDIKEKDISGDTVLDIATTDGFDKSLIGLLSAAMEADKKQTDGAMLSYIPSTT